MNNASGQDLVRIKYSIAAFPAIQLTELVHTATVKLYLISYISSKLYIHDLPVTCNWVSDYHYLHYNVANQCSCESLTFNPTLIRL